MPLQKVTVMSLRKQFIHEVELKETTFTALCKHYQISVKTGYKWLKRYREQGIDGLKDLSRRPHNIPNCTDSNIVKMILSLRQEYPRLGGRKIHHMLRREGIKIVPAPRVLSLTFFDATAWSIPSRRRNISHSYIILPSGTVSSAWF